jgi:hypothetical protein
LSKIDQKSLEAKLKDWHVVAQKAADARERAKSLEHEKIVLFDRLVLQHLVEHDSTVAEANRFARTDKSYDATVRKQIKAESAAATLDLEARRLNQIYELELSVAIRKEG